MLKFVFQCKRERIRDFFSFSCLKVFIRNKITNENVLHYLKKSFRNYVNMHVDFAGIYLFSKEHDKKLCK